MAKRLIAMVAVALALVVSLPAVRAQDQTVAVAPADSWIVRDIDYAVASDVQVPGRDVLRIAAAAPVPEAWQLAAVNPLPLALRAGERVTGVFWARADRPVTVPVVVHATAAPYAGFAEISVALELGWQRFVISGVAPTDLRSRSHQINVQLGKAATGVSLDPVLWMRGTPDEARIAAASASLRPDRTARDVRFPSDPGVVIAGTLRLPRGRGPGPFPVAVMIPGQGKYTRSSYRGILDLLVARGIATLEYDKRGAGQSTGTFLDTIPLMERDAAAAVAYLRTLPEIDAARIALVGHSQGGVIAPSIAARDPGIAALVTLAGPVGRRGEIFLTEMRRRLADGGIRDEAIERILAAAERFLDAQSRRLPEEDVAPLRKAVVAGFAAAGMTGEQARGATAVLSGAEVLSMFDAATYEALAAVRAPVLALYGSEDRDVSSRDSAPAAEAALAGHRDATVIVVPGVDHGFEPVATGEAESGAQGAAEAPDLVAGWLHARLRPPGQASPGHE